MQKNLVSSITCQPFLPEKQNPTFTAQVQDSTQTVKESKKEEEKKDDFILSDSAKSKAGAKLDNAKSLPSYVKRGLGGDPNSNFYEFMQISKIPYFLGGPGLVATILAGQNLFDIRANKAAKFNAKGMALGCAAYYIMMGIAKNCVTAPVKAFRGLDLNHPYVDVVENRAEDASGKGGKRIEHHSVYESSKFIRWDLLYNEDSPNTQNINSRYNKIAKKMGISQELNDSDSTVRPEIMETIKKARAWQYIIGAFAVMLGVGLGNQQIMKDEFCTGLLHNIKHPSKFDFKNARETLDIKFNKPLNKAFKALWKGSEGSISSKCTGKIAIGGFIASVLAANISILKATNKKDSQFVDVKEAK